MKFRRNLISWIVTLSKSTKTWTKSFNQYRFEPCFSDVFLTIWSRLQTAKQFKIQNRYHEDWPICDALKLWLKYTLDWEKKKENRKIEANLKRALMPKDMT